MSERVCADCYHAEAAHHFNSRDGSYRCRVPHCWCRDFYPPEGGEKMSDLVKRLRDRHTGNWYKLQCEAADEIERLEAEKAQAIKHEMYWVAEARSHRAALERIRLGDHSVECAMQRTMQGDECISDCPVRIAQEELDGTAHVPEGPAETEKAPKGQAQ